MRLCQDALMPYERDSYYCHYQPVCDIIKLYTRLKRREHGGRLIERARPRTFLTTTPSMPSNIDSGPHTPERNSKRREYNTIRKTRFYNAFDSKCTGDS